jgi:glycosyltransferase involved in cell wall biosynthesis
MVDPNAPREPHGAPLTVIVPLPPSYRGGTEEYAYRLASRYARVRPVRVLTTTVRWKEGKEVLDVGEMPVQRVPAWEIFQRPVLRPGAHERLRGAVQSSWAVQLHMPFPLVEKHVTRWARAAGVPTVLTYHMDADLGLASRWPGAGLITGAYRRVSCVPALTDADAVVSNSLGYAQASPVLSRFLPKVRVIHKGVDPDRLHISPGETEAPPRMELPATFLPFVTRSTKRIVFVGRLVPYKGLPILLEAVARLRRQGVDAAAYLAGKGPQEGELRRRVEALGLVGRVHFLGFIPDAALGDLYRAADVVACPSVSLLESTPTCLEEAVACGVPILGSRLGGSEEALPDDGVHGRLVPPGDVEAVTLGLRTLLEQPRPRTRLPLRTWDDTAEEYLRLFHELRGEPWAPARGHAS